MKLLSVIIIVPSCWSVFFNTDSEVFLNTLQMSNMIKYLKCFVRVFSFHTNILILKIFHWFDLYF